MNHATPETSSQEKEFRDKLEAIDNLYDIEVLRIELLSDIESIQARLEELEDCEPSIYTRRTRDALIHKTRHMRLLKLKENTIKRGIRSHLDEKEDYHYAVKSLYSAFRALRRDGVEFPDWADAHATRIGAWLDALTYEKTK